MSGLTEIIVSKPDFDDIHRYRFKYETYLNKILRDTNICDEKLAG